MSAIKRVFRPGTYSVNKTSELAYAHSGHRGTSLAKRYCLGPPGGTRAQAAENNRNVLNEPMK